MHKDSTDAKIIEYLKEDSRETFVEIGKRLKLSESAVRRRVKNLIDSKTIKKFTIEMAEENLTSALVLISVDSGTDTSKISQKLAKIEQVKRTYEITGRYDITVIISAPNIAEINDCIDTLRKIPGISDTNTVIILREVS